LRNKYASGTPFRGYHEKIIMTDWNARYEKGDTPWEKGCAAPPLRELLSKTDMEIWGTGLVLVPGCGTGHDVRLIAEQGLSVIGLDLAEQAILRAKAYPQRCGESYELGDFLSPAWRAGKSFSAIWEHTCYCAIHPSQRDEYARACAELIPAGGCLIAVFFLNPFDPDEHHEGPPHPASIEEIDARFASHFTREMAWRPESTYPGREGREWLAIYRRIESEKLAR
jgi:SAM-dependent methyltransferase